LSCPQIRDTADFDTVACSPNASVSVASTSRTDRPRTNEAIVASEYSYRWITYLTVLDSDLEGEVVGVGSAVTRFGVGDRVLGHAMRSDKDRNSPAEGVFQDHTVVLAHMTASIPSTLSYEGAAVLPHSRPPLIRALRLRGRHMKAHIPLALPNLQVSDLLEALSTELTNHANHVHRSAIPL